MEFFKISLRNKKPKDNVIIVRRSTFESWKKASTELAGTQKDFMYQLEEGLRMDTDPSASQFNETERIC